MLPNNNLYTLKTAMVGEEDKKKFLMEVSKVQNNLLNQGFEVTLQYQAVTQGIQNLKTVHYMYIEGKKLKKASTIVPTAPKAPKEKQRIMSHLEYLKITGDLDAFRNANQMDHNSHLSLTRFINTIYNRQKGGDKE